MVILLCFFARTFGAISPEIELTSALALSSASSTCAEGRFTSTTPYRVDTESTPINCSFDHHIDLLFDGNDSTWWQSINEDENVTLNFQFNDVSCIT